MRGLGDREPLGFLLIWGRGEDGPRDLSPAPGAAAAPSALTRSGSSSTVPGFLRSKASCSLPESRTGSSHSKTRRVWFKPAHLVDRQKMREREREARSDESSQ